MSQVKIQQKLTKNHLEPYCYHFPIVPSSYNIKYDLTLFLENENKVVYVSVTAQDLMKMSQNTKKNRWSQSQDKKLLKLVLGKEVEWEDVANHFQNRNAKMCYNRYRRLSYNSQRAWKKKDDEKIVRLVQIHGESWNKIQEYFPNKSQKQLKYHFKTHLRPGIIKDKWEIVQDIELVRLLSLFGCDWIQLSKQMPYRSYGQIKNRYYGRIAKIIQKKLLEGFSKQQS